MDVMEAARAAKRASIMLAAADTKSKNAALAGVAEALTRRAAEIAAANAEDLRCARETQLAEPLLKRLKFDEAKVAAAVAGIRSLIGLADPVGQTLLATELDQGLELYQVSCPIGVIGVIFESRPDALVQISTLCLKSGNAALLKGGSEAAQTNRILAEVIVQASEAAGMPAGWLQLLETRAEVTAMLALDTEIDLIVPRGSNAFVRHIMDHSNIPVLGHADGICHVYVDQAADVDMAVGVVCDAKCQYVAVCNAAETLLVHQAVAAAFLPRVRDALAAHHVTLIGCPRTAALIEVQPATEADWRTEYLDYTISIRVVDDLQQAVDHINTYGSRHTDAIVTGDRATAAAFMDRVDSANVFWNCSTRFSDGYRYGLGAEVGISTSKIHARGPVGLEGLVIYKWKLLGSGQTVAPYADGSRSFIHRQLRRSCPL